MPPATSAELELVTRSIGKRLLKLIEMNVRSSGILTYKAFENTIIIHVAIVESSNSLLHILAIACKLDIEIDPEGFDQVHRKISYALNIRTSGFSLESILVCRRSSSSYGGN